jgi:hypothetical protein
MYSLVSAPVLGFDLTRLGGGSAAAEVLLRALALRADDLPVLAGQLPDEDLRGPLWVDVSSAARQQPTLRGLAGLPEGELIAQVEAAPVGSVDALLRCLRYDVLSWTWRGQGRAARQDPDAERATSVLCDAAVASYLRDLLPPLTRRRLAAPWVAAIRRLPPSPPLDLGPHHGAVNALLGRLRTVGPAELDRLSRAVNDTGGKPTGWSTAVHSASWAAYLSDRVRTAAAAQLLLVQAVDVGAVPRSVRAGGVWNLLSGAVQALVVRDLLDAATAHRLLTPVIAALGPAWLT